MRGGRIIDRRLSNWLIVGAVMLVGGLLAVLPIGAVLDRALFPARFGIVQRVASGKVVVVEMDAQTVAAIKHWPWSRSNYTAVVDNLRRAGAASIVFDVDFSSPADAAGDRSFAAALVRADGLVTLPTFGQNANSTNQRTIDALPIPLFRNHVALASVSIAPDTDGQVRSMPFGTVTAGVARPSLSAYIAQRSGTADNSFPIDMSIQPATIPRLSFVDVRNGNFDPTLVRGRSILIGATAVELGDRYSTTQWGVIPGVIVQAMAAETLLRGVPADGSSSLLPFLVALGFALVITRMKRGVAMLGSVTAGVMVLSGAVLFAQHVLLITYPLAPALCIILVCGLVCGIREVAGRFRMQRMTDEETGLPNGRSFMSISGGEESCTLIVAQIDNLETLAAVLGSRQAADVVMRLSDRLALIANDRRVYRTANHQLSFLLPDNETTEDTLDGLRPILLQPIEVGGRRVDVDVALGVATGTVSGLERLSANAALAAEDASRGGSFWARCAIDDGNLERSISLMGELDAALAAGHIEVYYQPKYNLRAERITSAEALVRWRHPERGFVGPDTFIPLAEKTNRIEPLTLYVLRQVVRDVSAWRGTHGEVTAAINISAKLLSDAAFNADVEAILRTSDVPASSLIFEVTESAAMSNPASAIAALQRYRDLGIAVSMDDYGTGQSTLTYIKQLPLNELKIDRSFVQHAHVSRADGVLVRSTIRLAHDLGLKVVAEGVEDLACLEFLKDLGCDLIQGYFISRPIPYQQFREILAQNGALAA